MLSLLAYQGNFFQSSEWFSLLAETTDVKPVVFSCGDGVLPCKQDGSRLSSLTNFYSIEYSPIGHFEPLLAHVGSRIDLQFVPRSAARYVERTFRGSGFHVFLDPQYPRWTCPINSGFRDYFAARPSALRNTVKRKSKALTREHSLRIEVIREPRPGDYEEIYNASWKRPEPYKEFIPQLMDVTSRLGILRLGFAYIDDEPAAAQIWFVESGRALIYKLAYKEKFKATSVGSVLSHEMFRQAIDVDGVSLVDYGIGDEPYKRDWMTEQDMVYQMTCIRQSAIGSATALLRGAKRELKKLVRRHQRRPLSESAI